MVRRAARKDANSQDVVAALRAAGCRVHIFTEGRVLDLLVGVPTPDGRGVFVLIEVKTESGDLTPAQEKFIEEFRGCPCFVVRSAEEAIEIVERVARGQS